MRFWRRPLLFALASRRLVTRSRKEKCREEQDDEDRDGGKYGGAEREAGARATAAGEAGDVSAEDIDVAGEGVVGFVDGVSVDDGGSAGDARLGVDDGVAGEDCGVATDMATYGEVAEEDKDVAGEVAFDLNGAEEAGGVADLLAGGDEDVLAEVGAVGVRMRRRHSGWRGLTGLKREDGTGEEEEHPGELVGVDRQRLAPFARPEIGAGVSYVDGKAKVPFLRPDRWGEVVFIPGRDTGCDEPER